MSAVEVARKLGVTRQAVTRAKKRRGFQTYREYWLYETQRRGKTRGSSGGVEWAVVPDGLPPQ